MPHSFQFIHGFPALWIPRLDGPGPNGDQRGIVPSFCGCYNRRMLLAFFVDSLAPALRPPRPPNPFPQSCFPPLCLYCCSGFFSQVRDLTSVPAEFCKFLLDKPLRYYYYYLSLTIQPIFYLLIHSSNLWYLTVRQGVKNFAKVKVLPLHPQIQIFCHRKQLDWSSSWQPHADSCSFHQESWERA